MNIYVARLFSLLWSAKTPLKVCDTSISMISFYKMNFFLILVSPHHLEEFLQDRFTTMEPNRYDTTLNIDTKN